MKHFYGGPRVLENSQDEYHHTRETPRETRAILSAHSPNPQRSGKCETTREKGIPESGTDLAPKISLTKLFLGRFKTP